MEFPSGLQAGEKLLPLVVNWVTNKSDRFGILNYVVTFNIEAEIS